MVVADGVRHELLSASVEEIEEVVSHADPMVLRGLLYQLTGDPDLVEMPIVAEFAGQGRGRVLARTEDADTVRRKTVEFLQEYRESGAGEVPIGPTDRLATSLSLVTGEEMTEDRLGLVSEELGLDPWARSLQWRKPPPPKRLERFSVTIIGAGMGGLSAALQFKRAGIRATVIEKNSGVGGTWFETRYPGARVDTPSRGYGNSFAADYSYSSPFCEWSENRRYFDWMADTFELRDDIVLNTEVRSMAWNETDGMWELDTEGPNGRETIRSNAVVTAVGYVNRPKMPEIKGMEQFRGRSWHTARWPEDFDYRGKRIAVIGTGCTGYQLVPKLAVEAEHVVVFQRTPQWLVPIEGYLSPYPPEALWLERNVPFFKNFSRVRMLGGTKAWKEVTEVDPGFDDPHSLSELNRGMRDRALTFLREKLDDPGLIELMTPAHPVWSARPVVVDPEYCILDAILRDNVTLATDGIRQITPTGIEAADGTVHEVDAIVYATGFHGDEYLYPMSITGREGRVLEEFWKDGGGRSYNFCMVAGFPNMWSLYGPNTNGGTGPNSFHEMVIRYILECIEHLILEDRRSIVPTDAAYWRFNREVDELNARRVWSDPRTNSFWASKAFGRSTVMCPFSADEIWRTLRWPDLSDLDIR